MTSPERPSTDAQATWAAFATDAPELAERVRGRFDANLHHVLGTVRPNGAPRLSGSEVTIGSTAVTIGMMGGSRKLADVRRDPRVEIHSAPLEEDLANGDAKLVGRLVETQPGDAQEPDAGHFEVLLELVSLVRVDGNELEFTTWRPGRGLQVTRRR